MYELRRQSDESTASRTRSRTPCDLIIQRAHTAGPPNSLSLVRARRFLRSNDRRICRVVGSENEKQRRRARRRKRVKDQFSQDKRVSVNAASLQSCTALRLSFLAALLSAVFQLGVPDLNTDWSITENRRTGPIRRLRLSIKLRRV